MQTKKAVDFYKGPFLEVNVCKITVDDKMENTKVDYIPKNIKCIYNHKDKNRRTKSLPCYLHSVNNYIHPITNDNLLQEKYPKLIDHLSEHIYNKKFNRIEENNDLKLVELKN